MSQTDRQKLESMRLCVAHLAKSVGVEHPLIEGDVNDWIKRSETQEEGWSKLILFIMHKVEMMGDVQKDERPPTKQKRKGQECENQVANDLADRMGPVIGHLKAPAGHWHRMQEWWEM